MGAKTALTTKSMQFFLRMLQFFSAVVILAITCYWLSTQSNRKLPIPTWERAVAGISGIIAFWTLLGLVSVCCIGGHPASTAVNILMDIVLIGALMYIAYEYRDGAQSCRGNNVPTVYGPGPEGDKITDHYPGSDGWTRVPTFRVACNMSKAVLAVSIIAIFLMLLSLINEFLMMRARKSHKAAIAAASAPPAKKGMFAFRRKNTVANPNALPHHPEPTYGTHGTHGTTAPGTLNRDVEKGTAPVA